MSEEVEPGLRDEVLEAIARGGKCFTNEAKAMARELIELRQVLQRALSPQWVGYELVKLP